MKKPDEELVAKARETLMQAMDAEHVSHHSLKDWSHLAIEARLTPYWDARLRAAMFVLQFVWPMAKPEQPAEGEGAR